MLSGTNDFDSNYLLHSGVMLDMTEEDYVDCLNLEPEHARIICVAREKLKRGSMSRKLRNFNLHISHNTRQTSNYFPFRTGFPGRFRTTPGYGHELSRDGL